ncbi:VOC family protein [Alkalicoccus halolimnae]|uniref:VOC family protein n=1 Tax=Alkalicoccus halolimnae TaxID=1667239 RepID=A0A5C7FGE3_9BACI|nr:VOC family protein [Alkalicoccus halolimnae]TXF82310.1 VOC family protein [Alkalicoccus halolimnae]
MTFHSPPALYVSEAALKVKDLETTTAFYEKTLGFSVLQYSSNKAVLTADGSTPLLTLHSSPFYNKPARSRTGLFHIAFLLPDRASLGGILQRLLENNYPLQGASDHHVSEALYLADPEGNGLELYCDRPAENWKWENGKVAMVTEPLDAESLLRDAVPFTKMPPNTILGHIHLQVNHLNEARSFYKEGLEFNETAHLGSHASFLSSGGYHHHLAVNTWGGTSTLPLGQEETGLKHFTIVYPDREVRSLVVNKLRRKEMKVTTEENLVYVTDPAGIQSVLAVK